MHTKYERITPKTRKVMMFSNLSRFFCIFLQKQGGNFVNGHLSQIYVKSNICVFREGLYSQLNQIYPLNSNPAEGRKFYTQKLSFLVKKR